MVEICQRFQIKVGEDKRVTIPNELVKKFQEKKFLKLRPTCQAIVQLISGGKQAKNASLSQCSHLQELIQARNQKIAELWGTTDDKPEAEQLFEDQPQNEAFSSKKRKATSSASEETTFVVIIQVGGQDIECLVYGQRPARSDLCVAMEPTTLEAVFDHLKEGSQKALNMPTKPYKKTKKG